jgi:hypothetical protein
MQLQLSLRSYIKPFILLFVSALLVRALWFGCYIQFNERYRQADSGDYHSCAVCIARGSGMFRWDLNYPIFWRTPGYPLYLQLFYRWFGMKSPGFSENGAAQRTSVWIQIILCACVPFLIFLLAQLLVNNIGIAWLAGAISVFHLGFSLASCYIMSDGLALILFLLFLLFFYRSFSFSAKEAQSIPSRSLLINAMMAALFLGAYTWIRPNGQFLAIAATIILLFGGCSWWLKGKKIGLFLGLFFLTISGWYIRNYHLTGEIFYCPMSGPYLQTFCVPKILRRLTGKPLEHCMKYVLQIVMQRTKAETEKASKEVPCRYVSRELICAEIAWPVIKRYPIYFIYDWCLEVLKTLFDFHASHLVAFSNNTYTADPPEEFLLEKWYAAAIGQPMHPLLSVITWLDIIFSFILWLGIVGGVLHFFLWPLFVRGNFDWQMWHVWCKAALIIGASVVMTGGFGYARLRLTADPLLIILSLTFWYAVVVGKNKYMAKKVAHEKAICAMA